MQLKLNKIQIFSITIGVIYGITCQLAGRQLPISSLASELFVVMSFGYVFVLPIVLGILSVAFATKEQQKSWDFRIFNPICTVALSLFFSILVGWEGAICATMAFFIYLPLAALSGTITGLILSKRESNKLSTSLLVIILSLPLGSAYLEQYFELPSAISKVKTKISIEAPVANVWQNIIRVPKITEELDGFFYKMGFPKPLEATLSYEGIGGVREASFEGGLLFIETVAVWKENEELSFTIVSDPKSVHPTTLDEHVVVGGRYFDVFRGTYRIEKVDSQNVILHLSSDIRVSTRFNFYSGMWANFLMKDIQNTILKVIKQRAEKPIMQKLAHIY